ncbi:translation initiation factor IF-2 [Patescibacteria group bacterium]|nr:translation initiation factor IF-2 [Patescibacteria group bacterium]
METTNTNMKERSPIVAIMGHIDHGKSTLLSYIRHSTEPLNEAGGITQHISAYEVEHFATDGKKHTLTFIDTPGHEAFSGIRKRGAKVADVAILVVSAEDGVKPQTIEALHSITESKTPYIVAINKIDKPGIDIERTKQSLAENQIYVEGYGGDVPLVLISAKTGQGIPELFDMIILVSQLESLQGDSSISANGIVIESNRDVKKGISATCIIKNGTLTKSMYITSGLSSAPIRIMENYLGKQIENATFSSPIKIIGWDSLPEVGNEFKSFKSRDEAREQIEKEKELRSSNKGEKESIVDTTNSIPVILKADTGSSLEAMISEIKKLTTERISAKVISSGIGTISENDVRLADGNEKAIIIGFNVKVDSPAKNLADRNEIEIQKFDIIYKMNEWLKEVLATRTPKMKVEESTGLAKILKLFSKVKDKQIIGGRVEKGSIVVGSLVKISRRDVEIGEGRIRELQQQKSACTEVKEGKEFGGLIVANIEIAAGDKIESFITIEK